MAWALRRALRLAVAVAVVALVLATTIAGADAERLATTAYLAAIFAAIVLVVGRFLPSHEEPAARETLTFPSFLGFLFAVALVLGAAASLVSEPGVEAGLFAACLVLVALAVLTRAGAVSAINARLVRGGFAVGATRYAVAIAIAALALAAVLPADAAGVVANVAYRLAVAATAFVTVSLAAPTPFGVAVRRGYTRLGLQIDRLARELFFARTARYAAIGAALVLIPASLLLAPYSEPFAVAAYVAAVVAAFCVAMECRRLRE